MDAQLNPSAHWETDTLRATLNTEGTHVCVRREGRMTRRGRVLSVEWVSLPPEIQDAVTEWSHAESMARYGDDWRADRADALFDALGKSILDSLS